MTFKFIICFIAGAVGGVVCRLFGGWSAGLVTLCIALFADYITGIIVAGVFKNSSHTENGCLESRTALKGIIRKFCILLIVALGYRLDITFGSNYIKDAVVITFLSSEIISLLENCGLMGIPIPKPIINAISVLRDRVDDTDKGDDNEI